jgi:hypothetical protein
LLLFKAGIADEVLQRSLVPLSSLPDQLNLISREEAKDQSRHILSNFSPSSSGVVLVDEALAPSEDQPPASDIALSSGAMLNLRASSSGLEITNAALEDQLTSSSSEDNFNIVSSPDSTKPLHGFES